MRDSQTLRNLLTSAVENTRSAEGRDEFMSAAREICGISRSLNFALAEQRCPNPSTLADIAGELTNAGDLVLARMRSLQLTDEDKSFAQRVARLAVGRAEDIRKYRARALAAGPQAAMAL